MAFSHYHCKHILIYFPFHFHLCSSTSPAISTPQDYKQCSFLFIVSGISDRYVIFKHVINKTSTFERVASAMRHRMKQNSPNSIVRAMRKTPVLLLKSVFLLLGSRSACVTAIIVWVDEKHNSHNRFLCLELNFLCYAKNIEKNKKQNCLEQRLLKGQRFPSCGI